MLTYNTSSNTGPVCGNGAWKWIIRRLFFKMYLNRGCKQIANHMSENPKIIERHIVVKGEKAVLGRPPEKVRDFLIS